MVMRTIHGGQCCHALCLCDCHTGQAVDCAGWWIVDWWTDIGPNFSEFTSLCPADCSIHTLEPVRLPQQALIDEAYISVFHTDRYSPSEEESSIGQMGSHTS